MTLNITNESVLTRKQKKTRTRQIGPGDGCVSRTITVEIRHDDECGNGHNTFAITGDITGKSKNGRTVELMGGCIHEEIAKYFPDLAPFLKWHLVSTDGPMHYVANTLYMAGDRDYNGLRAGEPHQYEIAVQFGDNPIKHNLKRAFVTFLESAASHPGKDRFDFEVLPISHDGKGSTYKFEPKYTFGGYADKWHECPFDSEAEALDFLYALQHCDPKFVRIVTSWGKGKERELDHARSAAVWPEATDEELSQDRETLKAALEARLPALLADFRRDVESLGFVW